MRFNEIIEAVKKQEEKPHELSPDSVEGVLLDHLDQAYSDLSKKHRNLLTRFNNWFELISHPFVLVIIFVLVFTIFVVFR